MAQFSRHQFAAAASSIALLRACSHLLHKRVLSESCMRREMQNVKAGMGGRDEELGRRWQRNFSRQNQRHMEQTPAPALDKMRADLQQQRCAVTLQQCEAVRCQGRHPVRRQHKQLRAIERDVPTRPLQQSPVLLRASAAACQCCCVPVLLRATPLTTMRW